jgi:hypothetical protein
LLTRSIVSVIRPMALAAAALSAWMASIRAEMS